MAKTAKPKKAAAVNPRSRAARRAASPSLNTDKSIKEVPRASDATPVLKPHVNGGIQKKSSSRHRWSRSQRRRAKEGQAKAEAINDRLEGKVDDAKARLKKRQGRRAQWDDVNDASKEEVRKAIKVPMLEDDHEVQDTVEPFHGDTEIKVVDGVQVPTFATGQALNVAVAPTFMATTKKPGTFGIQSKQPQPEEEIT